MCGSSDQTSSASEEKELLFDHMICMSSPGEVLSDVNSKEFEAADPLYCSPADGRAHMFTLLLPVVVGFVQVETEVIFLDPLCQGVNLHANMTRFSELVMT